MKKRINRDAGKKFLLTDEDRGFIWENYRTMTVCEMSDAIGKITKAIYDFMNKNELTPKVKQRTIRKSKVPEGCFDVNSRDDWFIG